MWPDSEGSVKEGEYYRNLVTENMAVEMRINYKPKNMREMGGKYEEKL